MDPWDYWRDVLHSPRLILAPMVDHSELPWRMLSREYGCQVAYTPMFHAANFVASKKYRLKQFSTCPEDRPLVVQFCANNPDILLTAAKHVEHCCDAIDINLGCPQEIAKRGHYGAFLQDEWELIDELLSRLRSNLNDNRLGISCKIRRFEQVEKTIDYARMLEKAGCTFIGIHARTREQRGVKTGAADWSFIKAVKDNVSIPVIANGNVQSLKDANDCLAETGADAVMTAEGNLYNPGLFLDKHLPTWTLARRYLHYVRLYPIPPNMAKSHLFKLFHKCIGMEENKDLRSQLGQASSLEQLDNVVDRFEKRYQVVDEDQTMPITVLPVPAYLCQPRFRYEASEPTKVCVENNLTTETGCDKRNLGLGENVNQKRIKV